MIYYGEAGRPVGCKDGEWLFDERGEVVGHVYERHVYGVSKGRVVGKITPGAIYNADGEVCAFGEDFNLTLLGPTPRLAPAIPRLFPVMGPNLESELSKEIPPALSGADLCSSLAELREQP